MSILRESVDVGSSTITLETGRLAKQADGSVLVTCADTVVLVTVCGANDPRPGVDFFPLSCDYVEKTYAAGKIPGGFFKREGKLRDEEILVSRLIDRPCRPLFPDGYRNDVQIIATVMSFDPSSPADVLAVTGASCALTLSDIPWMGPLAGIRVGRIDGRFVANPSNEQLEQSDLDIVVAATRDAIVMVEGSAEEIPESELVDALMFAHKSAQPVIDLQLRLREAVGKTKRKFTPNLPDETLKKAVLDLALKDLREACTVRVKQERSEKFKGIEKRVVEALTPKSDEKVTLTPSAISQQIGLIKTAFHDAQAYAMRTMITDRGIRIDGRDTRTVRPITCEVGLLPRVHGSSLFTRGETQGLVTVTLGTHQDEQKIDSLSGERWKRFLLHYNFPPFSVGESKPLRGPGRREVGHGNLAERAILRILPNAEQFPYTVRVVSEILESNGSSSMATVCGGSLALMDAGVPVKAPVAGVAMGLIKEGDRYAVLTDILGDEDHLGDMDFKVCGTLKGVTAIQMDIKIEGLSREILSDALAQAREGRLHILNRMQATLAQSRPDLSQWAPRITQVKVRPDQVREIIGPGGKTIKGIVDQTGVQIDIQDDGTVKIASANSAAVRRAIEIIRGLTAQAELGAVYQGVVKRLTEYGAFIELFPGTEGLLHVSEMAHSRVENPRDLMSEGDSVEVKVVSVDDASGKVRLSHRILLPLPEGEEGQRAKERMERAHAEGITPSSSRGDRPKERSDRSRDRGDRSKRF